MLNAMKDSALSLALKAWIEERFDHYGEVIDCALDTRTSTLSIEALLRGEREPISATVERYELERVGDQTYVVLKKFSSSRAWLATLLTTLFAGKRYAIPAVVSRLL